jgi:hypothetical protein
MSAPAFGQEKAKRDTYSATWLIVGGGASASSMPINIYVDRYNTDEEMKKYREILLENGQVALQKALYKEEVGQYAPMGRVGTPLAIARRLPQGDKTMIRVLTVRDQSIAELRNSGLSVNYPYMILEFLLDKDGKGNGTAIGAGKIKFDKKKKTYEIESFQQGALRNRLVNVRQEK